MKSLAIALTFTAGLIPFAAQASEIVNVNALCSNGTSITLVAGTYDISVIGTSQGGEYNAWDQATTNFGKSNATPAAGDWKDSFTITANGKTTDYVASGDPHAASALSALEQYQSSVLDLNSKTTGTVLLTLTSAECVNFKVSDYMFNDNWGGESFKISPVAASAAPEPATFGMMGLALAGVVGFMRKKIAR